MSNKINMTREENVFLAKRNLVDTIYKSAKLEGLAVTFPQTEAIVYGGKVSNLRADEICAVNNLKHAWSFVFESLDYPLDYAYICRLHNLVASNLTLTPGFLRKGDVQIGGIDPKDWIPEVPDEEEFKLNLRKLRLIEDPTERAVETMLYCMRTQPFWDGNKRVSMLAANQILVSHGRGILSVQESDLDEFKALVVDFYKFGDNAPIKKFIMEKCVYGVDLSQEHESKDWRLPPLDEAIAKAELERDRQNFERIFSTENLKKNQPKER